MRQWFRGQLEAHYEGVASTHAAPAKDMRGKPHQIRIYRAQVRGLELIDAPPTSGSPQALHTPTALEASLAGGPAPIDTTPTSHVFYQARVEHARLESQSKRGVCLEGPIFELSLHAPRLTHPARYEGRLFGRVEGPAIGCFELPEEPELQEAVAEIASVPQTPPAAPPAEQTTTAPELVDTAVRVVPLESPVAHAQGTPANAHAATTPISPDVVHTPPESAPAAKAPPSNLPLLALVAALALTLLAVAGAGQAGLWLSFLLPSLLIRRFLRGVLPDATAFRAIGAILIGAQVCCVSLILLGWSAAPCKELHVLPLIALVAGVFFASVLPYLMPIAVNAIGFALVLGMWSVGPGEPCRSAPTAVEAGRSAREQNVEQEKATPSVKHPGEPRTNRDGSWPKQP